MRNRIYKLAKKLLPSIRKKEKDKLKKKLYNDMTIKNFSQYLVEAKKKFSSPSVE